MARPGPLAPAAGARQRAVLHRHLSAGPCVVYASRIAVGPEHASSGLRLSGRLGQHPAPLAEHGPTVRACCTFAVSQCALPRPGCLELLRLLVRTHLNCSLCVSGCSGYSGCAGTWYCLAHTLQFSTWPESKWRSSYRFMHLARSSAIGDIQREHTELRLTHTKSQCHMLHTEHSSLCHRFKETKTTLSCPVQTSGTVTQSATKHCGAASARQVCHACLHTCLFSPPKHAAHAVLTPHTAASSHTHTHARTHRAAYCLVLCSCCCFAWKAALRAARLAFSSSVSAISSCNSSSVISSMRFCITASSYASSCLTYVICCAHAKEKAGTAARLLCSDMCKSAAFRALRARRQRHDMFIVCTAYNAFVSAGMSVCGRLSVYVCECMCVCVCVRVCMFAYARVEWDEAAIHMGAHTLTMCQHCQWHCQRECT